MKYLGFLLAAILALTPATARELRICADPNNLPFSNRRGEGFENRIAALVAKDLGAQLRYVWWAQRRGNVRETLNAGRCDLIPGVASSLEMLGTTRPYYRSAYVAVVRDGPLRGLGSFDDPRLASLKIGVQLIGDDGANTPPAFALTRRGMIDNIRGYTVYGDYRSAAPQSGIIDALARGDIDVAFVWGPTAGYFAGKAKTPLTLAPVIPLIDGPQLPMAFDISMGVRKDDLELKREVEAVLAGDSGQIRAILTEYRVPLIDPAAR